jgi:hypothetical protein
MDGGTETVENSLRTRDCIGGIEPRLSMSPTMLGGFGKITIKKLPPVDSPQAAVKAAIVAQVKNDNKEA